MFSKALFWEIELRINNLFSLDQPLQLFTEQVIRIPAQWENVFKLLPVAPKSIPVTIFPSRVSYW